MLGGYKALGLTRIRSGTSLLRTPRILIRAPYSLPLAPPIYIGTIYSLICLNSINIRTLRRLGGIGLPLRTLLKILILLLTGSTNILSFLGRTYLWAYLTLTTFSIILSGNYMVVTIYTILISK